MYMYEVMYRVSSNVVEWCIVWCDSVYLCTLQEINICDELARKIEVAGIVVVVGKTKPATIATKRITAHK